MPSDSTYNGWANWDTWVVALWLGGDEEVYNATRMRFKGRRTISEDSARAWCTHVRRTYTQVRGDWGARGTRNTAAWSRVCWAEIVDCIKEMTDG